MDAVEEIKSRLNIEDVVSEYVQLKRAGRNFKGISPWTNEKTASLMVSPEKQIWHDFSSGKGGNMFSFVMEMEGLDFKGALEHLARKAGVELEQYRTNKSSTQDADLKKRLSVALELSTKFYQVQLSKHTDALEYVRKTRGFQKQTILTFRLGYSPNNGTALLDYLKKQGVSVQEAQQAGLITQRRGGYGDMFRGRIMVPLMDAQGSVIGFTARLLVDEPNAPKYINTPQTMLYDKSRHVFGLHLAKPAIRIQNFVVLTEGNLDVIASYQAGVENVVCTAGTATTAQQLKALSRFTKDVRLAYDQDRAGLAATERAIPIAQKTGVQLSIITIPSGKDPDELIRQDASKWSDAITKHSYAVDWLIQRYSSQLDIHSAQGKRQFSDTLIPIIRELDDVVEQDHYLRQVAEMLEISKDSLKEKMLSPQSKQRYLKKPKQPLQVDKTLSERTKLQDQLLAIALHNAQPQSNIANISSDMLVTDDAKTLFSALQNAGDKQAIELLKTGEYAKILELLYEALYESLDESEVSYEATRLQARLIDQYVKSQKNILILKLQDADEQQQQKILAEVKELDQLLRPHKEA